MGCGCFIYRCLSKVMANKLRKVLPDIILDNHGAFVDGHRILDGVLVAHECVDSRNNQLGLVCKLDFAKAYDMVDWDFFHYMMVRMSFGVKWKMDSRQCLLRWILP